MALVMPVAGLRTEWFVRGRRLADAPLTFRTLSDGEVIVIEDLAAERSA